MIGRLLNLFRRRPNVELLAMRLADMHRVHPQQITARCSKCNHEVGVFPSGQRVLRDHPNAKLVCHVCARPADMHMLAPGAENEPSESVWRQ